MSLFGAVSAAYESGWHSYLTGLHPAPASASAYATTYDVSAMVLADTFPARSLSSMASVNRVNVFAVGDCRSAYRDSRNST